MLNHHNKFLNDYLLFQNMKEFLQTVKKYLIRGTWILAGLALLFMTYAYFGSFSEGFRAGTVVKISKKGFVFKTYEGQLNVEGIMSQDLKKGITSLWDFSVPSGNHEALKTLEEAALEEDRVKIFYEEKIMKFPWIGDTKYFVTRVERLHHGQQHSK